MAGKLDGNGSHRPLSTRVPPNVTCISALPSTRIFRRLVVYLVTLLIFSHHVDSIDLKGVNSKASLNQCKKCKIVVDSFKEGLKRTSRGKHEGGDAYWEEKKLSNYANSEIRLTEIQENLCHEVSLGKDQCHGFAEEFEAELEEWFFQHLKKERLDQAEEGSTLFEHLCNQVAKVCCPEGHYGPDCALCPGYPGQVCNGRGFCAGNGTREGKGNCKCFKGYSGEQCEKCAKNYFAVGVDEKDVPTQLPDSCQRCDSSCASSCHSAGPRGCHVCRKGYIWDQETGCIDVNECAQLETSPCSESTYCVNTVGSFKCLQCNKACKGGCTGSGDDSCFECADNYVSAGGRCRRKPESDWTQAWPLYITYLCLIATTIGTLRASPLIGLIVGLVTITFIGIYELELNHNSSLLLRLISNLDKFYKLFS